MIISVVVTFNGMKWYDKCIGSLLSSKVDCKTVVVDNASTDNTVRYIKENFPEVIVIENNENLGFAKANNIGIKYALEHQAEYVFLLNQDAWVEKGTIETLYNAFQNNPGAGIISPIHLNGDRTGLDENYVSYITQCTSGNLVSDLYFGNMRKYYSFNFVNAAAWMVSVCCIKKVGGFDTNLFFHYGEDADYCRRVKYHNFEIIVSTNAIICHDRENRNTTMSEIIEKNLNSVDRKFYFSNLEIEDSLVENEIMNIKRRFLRKSIKYFLLFNLKVLLRIYREFQEEMKMFVKIKISRQKNRQGGLVWLV
jgi:GT2 family glycosyltransferase